MKKYEVSIYTKQGIQRITIEAKTIVYKSNSVIFYAVTENSSIQDIVFSCPAKSSIVKLIQQPKNDYGSI